MNKQTVVNIDVTDGIDLDELINKLTAIRKMGDDGSVSVYSRGSGGRYWEHGATHTLKVSFTFDFDN